MDADIQAAATPFDLSKIEAQDYRNDLKARLVLVEKSVANGTAAVENGNAAADVLQAVAASMAADDAAALTTKQELRAEIVRAIAVNYMKPTTGYLQATIADDTRRDANRLLAAVDAVEAIVLGTYVPTYPEA